MTASKESVSVGHLGVPCNPLSLLEEINNVYNLILAAWAMMKVLAHLNIMHIIMFDHNQNKDRNRLNSLPSY